MKRFIKRRFPLGLSLLVCLIAGKLLLSSAYLRLGPSLQPFYNTVLAEEKQQVEGLDPAGENRKLAEMLRKKEQELKDREIRLARQEQELVPLKEEIDRKLEELEEIQTQLTLFAKDLAEREEALNSARMEHLVSLYSAMAPAKAAEIMDKLNLETVVLILSQMRGKIAGQILAVMDPEKGAKISERLSRQN